MKLLVIGFEGADYGVFDAHSSIHRDTACTAFCLPAENALQMPSWVTLYTGQHYDKHRFGLKGRDGKKRKFAHIAPRTFMYKACDICTNYIYNIPFKSEASMFTKSSVIGMEPYCDLYYYLRAKGTSIQGVYKFIQKPPELPLRLPASYMGAIDACLSMIQKSNKRVIAHVVSKCGDVEFLFIVFTFIDRMGHMFTMSKRVALGVYKEMEMALVHSLKEFKPEHWMVVSPHGFKATEHYEHFNSYDALCIINDATIKEFTRPRSGTHGIASYILRILRS